MANPSRFLLFIIISLLFLDEEENNLHDSVISSDEATTSDDSFAESLSDDATSFSNVSSQAIMEADLGDLVATVDLVNYDDEDSDEDCYDEEEDDVDDELIQRSVSKKVKRERIRKVGKRTFAKVPYTQLKRGCIYGKHGFGIRFRC